MLDTSVSIPQREGLVLLGKVSRHYYVKVKGYQKEASEANLDVL